MSELREILDRLVDLRKCHLIADLLKFFSRHVEELEIRSNATDDIAELRRIGDQLIECYTLVCAIRSVFIEDNSGDSSHEDDSTAGPAA